MSVGRLEWAIRRLAEFYPDLPSQRPTDPLDELVGTILSQNTSDRNSEAAFRGLRSAFSDWESVIAAEVAQIAEAIRPGGLHRIKARRILNTLQAIKDRTGRLDLNWLRDLPQPEIRRQLVAIPGIGVKTAACVEAFSLGLPACPADTHVSRICKRLGLVPANASPEKAQALLESETPPGEQIDLPPPNDPIGPAGLSCSQAGVPSLSPANSMRLLRIANRLTWTCARAGNCLEIQQKVAAGPVDHRPL